MKNYLTTSFKLARAATLMLVLLIYSLNDLAGQRIEIEYSLNAGVTYSTVPTSGQITGLCDSKCQEVCFIPRYYISDTGGTPTALNGSEYQWTDPNGNVIPQDEVSTGAFCLDITSLAQNGDYTLSLTQSSTVADAVAELVILRSLEYECPAVVSVAVNEGCQAVLSEMIDITTLNCGPYSYTAEYIYASGTGSGTGSPINLMSATDNIALTHSFMWDHDADPATDDVIRYGIHDALIKIYSEAGAGGQLKYSCNPQVHVVDGNTNVACNDALNITLDRQCQAEISAEIMLEGDFCMSSFEVEIDMNGDGEIGMGESGAIVTIGRPGTFEVTVKNSSTGVSCWGTITTEDKSVPVLSCENVEVECSLSDDIEPGASLTECVIFDDNVDADNDGTVDNIDDDPEPVYNPSNKTVLANDEGCVTFDMENSSGVGLSGTVSSMEIFFSATVDSIQNLKLHLVSPDPDGIVSTSSQNTADPTTILLADFSEIPGFTCPEGNIEVTFRDNAVKPYSDFFNLIENCRQVSPAYLGAYQPATLFSTLSGNEVAFDTNGDNSNDSHTWKLLVTNDDNTAVTNVVARMQFIYNNGTIPGLEQISTGCGSNITMSHSDTESPLDCSTDYLKEITRIYTVTNEDSGFSNTCSHIIKVKRTALADIIFPENLDGVTFASLNCQQLFDATGLNPNYVSSDTIPLPALTGSPRAKFGELCENFQISYDDIRIRTCGEFGMKIIREWTVLDWCDSKVRQENQIIKINQRSNLTATCPPIQTISETDNNCTAEYEIIAPFVIPGLESCTSQITYTVGYLYDNDDDAQTVPPSTDEDFETTVNVFDDNGDGTPDRITNLPLGRTWVRYFFSDECGNTGQCTTEVDVVDNTKPNPVCIENTVIAIGDDGCAYLPALSLDNGSLDNCGGITKYEISRSANTEFQEDPLRYCCGCMMDDEMVYLRVTDESGNSNTCRVTVEIQNNNNPTVTGGPTSVERTCTAGAFDLYAMSEAAKASFVFVANCPTMTSFEVVATVGGEVIQPGDMYEPGECGVGSTSIKYEVTDQCGGVVGGAFNQSLSFTNDFSGFDVTQWPQDYTLSNCINGTEPENLPANSNASFIQTTASGCGSNTAISYDDQIFPDVVDACYKILRTWTVIDWCIVNAPGNTVDDGKRTYTQLIKVNDSSAPVIANLSDVFGNDPSCMHTLREDDVEYEITDNCTPAEDIVISYRVDGNPVSNIFGQSYPNGTTITIEAADHCDNVNTFAFRINTTDTEAPVPYCTSQVVTTVNASGVGEIWVSDFSLGGQDNCDMNLDEYFINELGLQTQVLTYDCDDIPNGIEELISVTVYFEDDSGNINTCEVSLILQDNDDACPDQAGSRIAGTIYTEDDKMVQDVKVDLMKENVMMTNSVTQNNGQYAFNSLSTSNDYMVVPHKEDNYLNGVSTIDLVMIQRHILGLQRFTSPYKVIAADTDNSGTINGVDLVELRKLILGITVEFPHGQQSWRMPVQGQTFVNPMSPFPYQETIALQDLPGDMENQDFIAVKIGDVNGSSLVSLQDEEVTTRSSSSLDLEVADVALENGSVIVVPVYARNMEAIVGLQSTLSFNPSVLQFRNIEARDIDVTEDNLGLYNVENGYITVSWNNVNGVTIDADEVLFELEFQVLDEGNLSEQLFLSSALTSSEAYTDDMETIQLNLNFKGESGLNDFVLYQNIPNPFADNTEIRFSLPATSDVTFTVYNVNGTEILRRTSNYEGGNHAIILNSNELTSAGVMYYKLETAHGTASRKMIQIR